MAHRRNNIFQKVREFIRCQAMLDKASGIVIAVSGGADSVALLDSFVQLRENFAKQRTTKELQLHVAHLNHLLRGKQADEDAEFVIKLCESLAVAVTIQAVDVNARAKELRKGVEETARELRYKFLLDVANQQSYNRIATGHTMSDQAETFIMRLARGAGLRGLAAMRPVTSAHDFSNAEVPSEKAKGKRQKAKGKKSEVRNYKFGTNEKGSEVRIQESEVRGQESELGEQKPEETVSTNESPLHPFIPSSLHPFTSSPLHLFTSSPLLIRPLLCITREEVETYCLERSLQFRTDASNESLAYTRNRVRHQTMKALRELNPQIVERIARTAEIIASDQDALEHLTHIYLKQAEISSDGWENKNSEFRNRKAYSIELIRQQPVGLRRRMIIEAIRCTRENVQPTLRQTSEIESVHIEAIEKLLMEGTSGHRITLPDGLQVWYEFNALVLMFSVNRADTAEKSARREHNANKANPYEQWISREHTSVEVAGFEITLVRNQPASILKEVIEEALLEKARSGVDWQMVALDDGLLPEKLCLRPRKKGESAWVYGQRKNNKLKKLMIDHKIASSRREGWPLVVTPDGEYVWSPGLPPALKFAASDKTQFLAIVRASDV
jgi:tRNA(Ile)-lysidine synthetase-like protein